MKKSTVIWLWGAGTGIASVVFSQVLYTMGQEDSGLRWINLLILFLGLFIGTMQFRDKVNEGYLSFGQGFKTGFLMSLIITLLITIATVVDIQIHPDFIDKILAKSRDNMINKGMSEDQIEIGMHYVKVWTTPGVLIITSIVFSLLGGAIFSLITAGLCTRKKPIFDDDNEVSGNDIPQT